ncbi:MAG TPA: carbon storage regulator, partial [Chloroflexota bacterium]|nr:carbon storage regulator [Chloroflexota bacterium]
RKCDQSLILGEDITITVLGIEGDRVKLGIRAPRSVTVLRDEVYQQLRSANQGAAEAASRPSIQSVAAALRAERASV